MGEELDIWSVLDNTHSKGSEMLDVALFDERSACPEDRTMEMLSGWESGFQFFDPVELVSNDI